jgi:beta-galactosidase
MFDFAADARDEGGVKGMNNKGLVTYDRKTKKDSFYLYKAYWNKDEKFVWIASKRFKERELDVIKVGVYTNLDEVTLTQNGEVVGTVEVKDHKATFEVKLVDGENTFVATSGECKDEAVFVKVESNNNKYVCPNAASDSVTNWFDESGNGMTFNRDYFSIKDKMKTIMENPHGRALLEGMMAKMMPTGGEVAGFKVSEGMLKMMMNFTIERMAKMAGKMFPQEALAQINAALQQIKK